MSKKYAIIVATYHRKNRKTAQYLRRMLDCLKKQTCQNFKLFIVGDHYIPFSELQNIMNNSSFDYYLHNNSFAL